MGVKAGSYAVWEGPELLCGENNLKLYSPDLHLESSEITDLNDHA